MINIINLNLIIQYYQHYSINKCKNKLCDGTTIGNMLVAVNKIKGHNI
jgi:hypothetical protein